jgi:hypothetical protein
MQRGIRWGIRLAERAMSERRGRAVLPHTAEIIMEFRTTHDISGTDVAVDVEVCGAIEAAGAPC